MLAAIFSALIPALEHDPTRLRVTKTVQRLAQNPGRRTVAATMVLVVAAPAVPVRASGMPTFDYLAWLQRESGKLLTDANHQQSEASKAYQWARQMVASYNDALWLRSQYGRLSGNVTLGVAQMLPLLERKIRGRGRYSDETTTIRPVLVPGEAEQWNLRRPKISVNFQKTNVVDLVASLRFDTTSTKTPTPDSAKSPEQIAEDAMSDGWMLFQRAQQREGIPEQYWNIVDDNPSPDPYAGLRVEVRNMTGQRLSELIAAAKDAVENYGEDSVEARDLYAAIADIQREVSASKDPAEVERAEKALLRLDSEAERSIERYAYLRSELAFQTKRDKAKDENLKELAAADSDWSPFSLKSYIEGKLKEANQDAQRDNSKSREHLKSMSETAGQAFREQLDRGMREELKNVERVAEDKGRIIDGLTADQASRLAAVRMNALNHQIRVDDLVWRLQPVYRNLEGLPIKPAMPETLGRIPGKRATPAEVASGNLQAATENAVMTADSVLATWQTSLKSANAGILAPVFSALDSASKAVLGRSFDLSNWSWAKEAA